MRKKLLTCLLLFLTVLFAGCTGSTGPNQAPEAQPTPPPEKTFVNEYVVIKINNTSVFNSSSFEHKIHDLIIAQRLNLGLTAIDWNEQLAFIARGHSKDMGLNNYFSHNDTEGRNFAYRYNKSGFQCNITIGIKGNVHEIAMGAENIFLTNIKQRDWFNEYPVTGRREYVRSDYYTQNELATFIVDGWMNSPSHREDILKPFWASEGIGVFVTDNYSVYATENFC